MIRYEYKMLQDASPENLMTALHDKRDEGWEPFGCPFFGILNGAGTPCFFQALTRVKSVKDNT